MKNIVLGILAHVDAGKTTLSEAMLYKSGVTRTLGRVDKGNAYLDTFSLERQRGITIFSKQAVFQWKNMKTTLLDTPGHVDFSGETERTLQILDYAVLVISGSDGVQGHTRTLWELLEKYNIPVFIFVNKMDMPDTRSEQIMEELKLKLNSECIEFTKTNTKDFYEEVSVADEDMLEEYINKGTIDIGHIKKNIRDRKIFPCCFGSALRLEGIEEFLNLMEEYTLEKEYSPDFGARIYKISRDEQGNRLTHMKITGGELKSRENIALTGEKVNLIRIYSGEKYEAVNAVKAGQVCAVTGLSATFAGQNLGIEENSTEFIVEPVLVYRVILPEGMDSAEAVSKLKILEEEEPMLSVNWNEPLQEIHIKVMGEVQLQIIKNIVKERFGIDIDFDGGNVVYMETIKNVVEGVGHFEPLKHYAEVHLKLEPLESGSGLEFCAKCSEDMLAKSWQKLILTHLKEKVHKGVLTGSPITDIKITLISGKAHLKHTEGGDFRQAVYRAVRQGLKMAESVLLEPYYDFRLEVPENMVGKAMTDIERRHGSMKPAEILGETSIITGYGPVITLREYSKDIAAYTRGQGKMLCNFKGYYPCHNEAEVIEQTGYDWEKDLDNPTGSIFCAHGAGFYVNYDEVYKYMHIPYEDTKTEETLINNNVKKDSIPQTFLGTEEVNKIISRAGGANKKSDVLTKKNSWQKARRDYDYTNYKSGSPSEKSSVKSNVHKENYLLVDGYNVIFAWEDLKELAETNIDGARGKLMDILCNYQALKQCRLIVVFDAYRIKGHNTETFDYHNIHVVFTKEAETADRYIEKFAHENSEKYNITVATSDGLEQIIIRGEGCMLISSRELKEEINRMVNEELERFRL